MNVDLVVFDLDFTLWDAGGTWCDHLSPPFKICSKGVSDNRGRIVNLYSDAMEIFGTIEDNDIPMAIASRTEEPEWARHLLDLLGIRKKFKYEEIFPDSKSQSTITPLKVASPLAGKCLIESFFINLFNELCLFIPITES